MWSQSHTPFASIPIVLPLFPTAAEKKGVMWSQNVEELSKSGAVEVGWWGGGGGVWEGSCCSMHDVPCWAVWLRCQGPPAVLSMA